MKALQLYIDGQLCDAADGREQDIICPATGKPGGRIAWAGETDATRALEAADKAFKTWSKLSIAERGEWIEKLAVALEARSTEFHEAVMAETGKPFDEADRIEWVTGAMRHYQQEMMRMRGQIIPDDNGEFTHEMVYAPLGVVVGLLAWNFPLGNVGDKVGQALAAGCTIVLKPSAITPLSAYLLGKACVDIDFPAGVINVLAGSSRELGPVLSSSKIPALMTMIGSTPSGLQVIRDSATSLKRQNLELGGNSPAIIFDDADLDTAIDTISAWKWGNAGQVCVSTNRTLVHESIAQDFLDKMLAKVRILKLGSGQGENLMGPLISEKSGPFIQGLIDDAVEQGAKIQFGADDIEVPEEGFYFAPTVLTSVTPEMRIWKEEIFGPVLSITTFKTDDEALALANDTETGLTSYLFTNDLQRSRRFAMDLEYGEVMTNGFKFDAFVPHVGIKQSGIGMDRSHLGLEQFLVWRRITTRV